MARRIERRYEDPLASLWLVTAERIGLRVVRVPDAYASTDGAGRLFLSEPAGFDPDDCLAQMILHELCHALVQGPESFAWIDWGLDNEGDRDVTREHACLRLQAALLEPWGLRAVLGPTTDFRDYYDALPADPFAERDPVERESIVLARAAYARRGAAPIGPHLLLALESSARVIEALSGYFVHAAGGPEAPGVRAASPSAEDADEPTELPLVFEAARPRARLHESGFPLHPAPGPGDSCAGCAWFSVGKNPSRGRCVVAGRSVASPGPVCERYEAPFECVDCGACCREAYDVVLVSRRDPAARAHPELLTPTSSGYDLRREDGRCVALRGGVGLEEAPPAIVAPGTRAPELERRSLPRYMPGPEPFHCAIYETRPRTCRDFTRGSANCLSARRAVGLSR